MTITAHAAPITIPGWARGAGCVLNVVAVRGWVLNVVVILRLTNVGRPDDSTIIVVISGTGVVATPVITRLAR